MHMNVYVTLYPPPHNRKEGQQDTELVSLSPQELMMMLYKMQFQPYPVELQTVPKTE